MKQISDKQKKINEEYAWRRRRFLATHVECEIGWDGGCDGWATQVDHIIGRGVRRDLILDESNWQACCAHCHEMKTEHPRIAHERGFTKFSWEGPPTHR